MTDTLEHQAAAVMMIGLPGLSLDDTTRAIIARGVRSFLLFGRNVESADQVRNLCAEIRAAAGEDAIIAIDHEGGRVNRLRDVVTNWPSPMGWAATGDVPLVRRASTVMAQELSALGINLNFAPVADLLGDYRNPVLGTRCFSDDPGATSRFVAAFVEGHRAAGVASTAKHFPGHGDTPTDSHVDLPAIARSPEQLMGEDIIPFLAAMRAGVEAFMISHVWYSALDREPTPATLSEAVAGLARLDAGYDGLIITDSMEMGAIQSLMATEQAVVRALRAGADMVMVSHGSDRQRDSLTAVTRGLEDGTVPARRLEEACSRIARLRETTRYGAAMPGTGTALAEEIARRGVTLVREDADLLPLARGEGNLGVVTFSGLQGSQVEDEAGLPPLTAALARRVPSLSHLLASPETSPAETAARLDGVGTVVVGSSHAVGRSWQAETVNSLLDAGKHVISVALGDPFDLLAYPRVPTFIAAYSDVPASAEAAAAILFGEQAPEGRLPVEIPGLYPRYHGFRQ